MDVERREKRGDVALINGQDRDASLIGELQTVHRGDRQRRRLVLPQSVFQSRARQPGDLELLFQIALILIH